MDTPPAEWPSLITAYMCVCVCIMQPILSIYHIPV
jgi:hypothetical protein